GNHGGTDCWIVKLNSIGDTLWTKSLGGTGTDIASSIQQTSDGGYIVAGYTSSNDGDVSGNNGSGDYWVIKLNSSGNITWQKCLGGSNGEIANDIQQTSDGGYIVAGFTESNDGDVSGNHGDFDYWVVKLDSGGIIIWQNCLGGTLDESANSVQQTSDGGYIVAGYTDSNDGDVSGNHGNDDYWVVKLNSSGNITWQNCLGGTSVDRAWSIEQTTDGYVAAGWTESNDNDVSGNHGNRDVWVVKLDSSFTSINEVQNSHYVIQAYPNPSNGQFTLQTTKGQLEIYDVLGDLIYSQIILEEETVLDISNQPNGIYFVNLKTEKRSHSTKVIIQK
ncbi:MAG: T9SS type A sorting domain-containing protein, partial [Bacteroidia bacterium]|nr:T9SS type A sorting domain-containing protein [Bacteroidia bacterium]